jgi:tetratricopeptide (TPR) repeat protein
MAEHRVYLASCGLFLVAGTFISWILSLALVTRRRVRYAFVALLGAEIALLAAGSYVRNIMWSDPVQLWLEAVARAPDAWQPRVGLGQAYHEAGQRRRAIEEYTRATELNPGFELSYQRVALLHLEQGEREQARQAFDRLRQRHPHSAVALNGLGAVAMFSGEPDVARIYFGESIGHNPTDVVARQSLASLVEDTDPAEALQLCEEIQRIAPRTPGNDDCIVRNRARLNGSSATVK